VQPLRQQLSRHAIRYFSIGGALLVVVCAAAWLFAERKAVPGHNAVVEREKREQEALLKRLRAQGRDPCSDGGTVRMEKLRSDDGGVQWCECDCNGCRCY